MAREYTVLKRQQYESGAYRVVPIRAQDKYDIMRMRNEQIYHLRQTSPLTKSNQDLYFKDVISKLFEAQKPSQILFSYLHGEVLIGYGGLVHINWVDKNAEISFIIKTHRDKEFSLHWTHFLNMITEVTFEELGFHKFFTYAFNLRLHLYAVLEENGFNEEARLKEHCFFEDKYIDVVIHSKFNKNLIYRVKAGS